MGEFIYTTALSKIIKMNKRIKVIQGGTSASKTFSIIPILIDKAIKNKNTSISIVSESFPHLRKGAIRDFLKIMKMTNRYIDKNWNKTNSVYTFTNGSYIEFFPADTADKLRGSRRNILFVNECNNITNDAYIQLSMRTDRDIFLDYNPSHSFWIDEVLKSKESQKIILTYKDNEALSENIINFLEEKRKLAIESEYWENWCRVYLDGEEGRLDGVIFNNWEVSDSIPDEAKLIGNGLDWGFTNDPSTLVSVYKLDGSLYLKEIFYNTGLLNSDIIKIIKDKKIIGDIYADSSEPKSIKELHNNGIKIYPAIKGKDSIQFGIQLLQNFKIYITKDSKNIINEFTKYSWKKSKTGESLNSPIDDFNHSIDALRYITTSKLSNKNKFVYKIL